MFELRPYQEECVAKVLAEYKQDSAGDALIVLPCGGGKTVVFSSIVKALNVPTLIIAHRDELLEQAAEKYRTIKPDAIIGKVGSGVHEYSPEVTVASIATISRPEHLRRIKAMGYRLIIIDEAHHAAASGYQKVLAALPDAFLLMVTATPERLDGQDISHKEPLYSCNIIDMIAQGYLCDVRAIAIRTGTSLDGLHTRMGDFSESELAQAVNTPARNKRIVDAYSEHAAGRLALAFCVTVEHAHDLADAFTAQGIAAATVTGETPISERQQIYKALRDGEIKVLCNVQVLTEGYDEPLIDAVIMARPTQSRALFMQCIGRGLRLAPAKQDCIILDLTDNCLKHRLQPQNLGRVLGTSLKNTESVKEAMQREAKEQAEREAVVRTLKMNRREDVQVNLFKQFAWKKRDNGLYVLEVGQEKHRIALIPNTSRSGYYRVAARLAPSFTMQYWSDDLPLGWAQQEAEKRAGMLEADAKTKVLFDRDASWRKKPVDPASKQADQLRRFHIPIGEGMTKGEAADILDRRFAQLSRRRQAS